MTRLYALAILCLVLTGCPSIPSSDHLEADRKLCNLIAPRYKAYIEADGKLTPEQKQRRLRTVDLWRYQVGVPDPATPTAGPAEVPW